MTKAQELGITVFPYEEFDENSNKIYYETSNGYWYKCEYDSNGNIIYYETSNDYWSKREFDSNSNKIYYENSDGDWVKWEYDFNNNQIYCETSNGYWYKCEYDSNNNKIYYEDSNGYIEDNRPKDKGKFQGDIIGMLESLQKTIIDAGGRFFYQSELKRMSVEELFSLCKQNNIKIETNYD